MYEIICLVVPRSPKLLPSGTRWHHQMAAIDYAFGTLCSPGMLRPAGWKRLPSIRRITDKLALQFEVNTVEFEFKHVRYFHPLSPHIENGDLLVTDALTDVVNEEPKPLVALLNGEHNVTLVGHDGVDFIFKNSYGNHDTDNPPFVHVRSSSAPTS